MSPAYQSMLRQLLARFPYRLDTNYAKMDRIAHPGIEAFKPSIGQKQSPGSLILSGQNGDDAQHYQEKQVRNAIREASK